MTYYTFYKLVLKPQWSNPNMSHDIREAIREELHNQGEMVLTDQIQGEYYIATLSKGEKIKLHMKDIAKLLA